MTKIYRSRLLASVHKTAEVLNQAGILDNSDMQMFSVLCLRPDKPKPLKLTVTAETSFK